MANRKFIKEQGLCLRFNLGTCPNTTETCPYKHVYFSIKSIGEKTNPDGKGRKSPRASSPAKPLSEEEKLARSKLPCPFLARGSCTFGDRCHYSHSAPSTQADSTLPGTVASVLSSPARPLSDEGKLARSKIFCPFQVRGMCSFGDRCHYSHIVPLTGDADVPATVAQAATVPGGVSVLAACASLPIADAVSGGSRRTSSTADAWSPVQPFQ